MNRRQRTDWKLEDLEALKNRFNIDNNNNYYAKNQHDDMIVLTPKVEDRLRRGMSTAKDLCCYIASLDMYIVWPMGYPDEQLLRVEIGDQNKNNDNNSEEVTRATLYTTSNTTKTAANLMLAHRLNETEIQQINHDIAAFTSAFEGSCAGYVMDIVEYAIDMLEAVTTRTSQKGDSYNTITTTSITSTPTIPPIHVLKYNHLLKGPEHAKEKQMVSIGKSNSYTGGIVYGTPGLVVLIQATLVDVSDFLTACRAVGKRGDVVYSNDNNNTATIVPTKETSLHKNNKSNDPMTSTAAAVALAEQLCTTRGLTELSVADVQTLVGGSEIFKALVLGIQQ